MNSILKFFENCVGKKTKFCFLGQFLILENIVTKFFRNSNFSDFLGIRSEISQFLSLQRRYECMKIKTFINGILVESSGIIWRPCENQQFMPTSLHCQEQNDDGGSFWHVCNISNISNLLPTWKFSNIDEAYAKSKYRSNILENFE